MAANGAHGAHGGRETATAECSVVEIKPLTALDDAAADRGHALFLAGGISNCPDWQSAAVDLFKAEYAGSARLTLINPRRNAYEPGSDNARLQIAWERSMLQRCSSVLFWFPKETLCPITLLELGMQMAGQKRMGEQLFVGWHPECAPHSASSAS